MIVFEIFGTTSLRVTSPPLLARFSLVAFELFNTVYVILAVDLSLLVTALHIALSARC
jgi:hypothetical protein